MADKNLNASLKIWIDGKEIPNTVNAISKEMRKLQREQKDMTIGSEEYVRQTKKIAELNTILSEHKNQLKAVGKETNSLASSLKEVVKFGVGGALGNAFTGLKEKIMAAAQESVELAKQAEGIELAFNRLDKPGLLEKLRQETHGAVSDLTLMTQAVKFKDFNLPIEQLGTYLAYAQQKAKDTGQDLGFLVDSIVTGLGRQSLPILDNLGLSATEIRAEMAKGGDMFTAVANIIKKNMAEAGEYTETAVDRAAQAAARLENAQVQLGKELLPIKENADAAFSQIQIDAIEAIRWIVKHRETLYTLVIAIAAVTLAYQTHSVWQKTVATWNTILATGNRVVAASMAFLRSAGVALHAVWALLTGGVKAYTVVMRAAQIASIANPWTALLTVITAVAAGFVLLARRVDDTVKAKKDLADIRKKAAADMVNEEQRVRILIAAAKDETMAMDDRKRAVNELNKIIPQYNAQIDSTTGRYQASKAALDDYLESLRKMYEIEGAKDKLKELGNQKSKLTIQKNEYETMLKSAGNTTGSYYTTSWGMVGNTAVDSRQHIQSQLDSVNRKLDSIKAQEDTIMGVYGDDIKKSAVRQSTPQVPDVSSTNTSVSNHPTTRQTSATTQPDAETERLKRIKAAQLSIEQEYQAERNRIMKSYVEDAAMSQEELQTLLENMEMDRLQKELSILGLEESEKAKVLAKIYDMRKTWKEREVEDQKLQEEQELDTLKEYLDRTTEEMDTALKEMEDIEKERSQLFLDVAQQFGQAFGTMMDSFFQEGKLEFGEFLKSIIKLTLDALEKSMVAAIAKRTIENVATLGLIGVAKAAGEIALITAAFETAKAAIGSFESGGFTGPGAPDEEKGVVHANEFVANRHATANPSVMPVLSLIDVAQKSGSVANLTSADIASVLPATLSPYGRTTNRTNNQASELLGTLAVVNKTNQMLLARLKQPIVAETYATGKRGVNEAQTLLEKMRSNVSRN